MVFTASEMHVITSTKKASFLSPLVDACLSTVGVTLTLHVKEKGEDGSTHIAKVLDAARATGTDG